MLAHGGEGGVAATNLLGALIDEDEKGLLFVAKTVSGEMAGLQRVQLLGGCAARSGNGYVLNPLVASSIGLGGEKYGVLAQFGVELLGGEDGGAQRQERAKTVRCMGHHAKDIELHRQRLKHFLDFGGSGFDVDGFNSWHGSPWLGQRDRSPLGARLVIPAGQVRVQRIPDSPRRRSRVLVARSRRGRGALRFLGPLAARARPASGTLAPSRRQSLRRPRARIPESRTPPTVCPPCRAPGRDR